MKKVISVFLTLVVILTAVFSLPLGASAETVSTTATLTPSGEHKLYRLPTMVITAENSILVAFEARYQVVGDTGNHDIVIMRSTDGKNFSTVLTVYGSQMLEANYDDTLTNPTFVVDNEGTIHFLFVCNTGITGVFHMTSDRSSDGLEWSEPVNISAAFKKNEIGWGMMNFGPSHGICVKNGEHRGRLIIPVWCYMSATNTYDVYTVYSDDNGDTWTMGEKVSDNRDETAIAELSDGSIMLNSRQFSECYTGTTANRSRPTGEDDAYRRVSISADGISNWSQTAVTELADPACQGSLCSERVIIDGAEKHALLFVNCNHKTERKNLTLRCSLDDGATWTQSTVLELENGGYSDVAIDNGGKIYVVYENSMGRYLTVKCIEGRFNGKVTNNGGIFKHTNEYQLSNDGTSKIRLVREISCDLNSLKEIGFEVVVQYKGKTVYKDLSCRSVYTSLLADNVPQTPKEGDYYLAHGISELPVDGIIFLTYRPYAIYLDGEREVGEWEYVNIENNSVCGVSATDGNDCRYEDWESLFG